MRPASTGADLARLAGLALAVVIALVVVASSGDLSSERVQQWVRDAGAWAPAAFVAISASLTVVLFPGPLLAGASGLLFGTALGFPLSLLSAVLGASMAFLIARHVGRDAVERRAGPRVARLREAIGRRGFVAVLYARIVPGVPYSLVNYAAGLAPIGLATFAGATALGAAPRAFAYTALGGSLDDLGSPEAIAAIAVLVALAVGGVLILRLRPSGSAAATSSPASPTAGPP
ncbi:MAG TPA: TVP38/TMEM64 family protein [Solirubrobacteraceae bacterium]|nr:TVP38/TMEM64 family protein [Solirubrobacteraceae bacterium]